MVKSSAGASVTRGFCMPVITMETPSASVTPPASVIVIIRSLPEPATVAVCELAPPTPSVPVRI